MCLQTLELNIELTNSFSTVVFGLRRLYVQDTNVIRENEESSNTDQMPNIFAMLVSNPRLEEAIMKHKNKDEEMKDQEELMTLVKENRINETLYQLVVKIDIVDLKTVLSFMFNNFRVVANEKTTEKLFKFLFGIIHSLDKNNDQLVKLKEEYMKYSETEEFPEVGPLKSDFKFVNAEEESTMFQSLMKVRENYLIKEKGVKVIKLEKLEEKKRLEIAGIINNVEVWVPLQWNQNTAKLMSITLSAEVNHSTYSHKDYYINNLTNLIFKVETINNVMSTNAVLNKCKVKIENYKIQNATEQEGTLLQTLRNKINASTLLKCYKVDFKFNAEDCPEDNEGDSSLYLTLQPIVLKLGFTDINEFQVALERVLKIVDALQEQNKDIINKIQEEYKEIQEKNESQQDKKKNSKTIVSKLAKKKQISTLKILFILDTLELSLVDDTGLYHQSLLSVLAHNGKLTLNLETGKEDPESYILRRLGIYEYPYMKGNFEMGLTANYYNIESGADEPLIEPWNLKVAMRKTFPGGFDTEGVIKIESDQHLNINMTYGVALVIKKTLDKIGKRTIAVESPINIDESKGENIDEEEETIEFKNNLGVDLEITVAGYQDAIDAGQNISAHDDMLATIQLPAGGAAVTIQKKLMLDITRKITRDLTKTACAFETFILRVDVLIENMNTVKSIPVVLTGTRSYYITPKDIKLPKDIELSFLVS